MDNQKQAFEEELKAENEVFKCPGCGANLTFEPEQEELTCQYCDYHVRLKGTSSQQEFDFFGAEDVKNTWNNEMKILHCQNCGANNVVEKKIISYECPFCGTAQVTDSEELPGLRPQRVLPFSVNKETTIKLYQNWIKRRFFAPKKLKKDIPNAKINGVYLPVWTYDAETFTSYRGRLGERYTRTVGTGKNRRVVTEIRYFSISGTKHVSFDDIVVSASRKISQGQITQLQPFNTNSSYLYDPRYLSGFSAEHYDISLKEGFNKAKEIAKKRIEQLILARYNYDVVSYLHTNTTYDQVKYKYVLIPVWICSFDYNKKTYRYYVNGETGRLVGSAPVSVGRVLLIVFLVLAVIALIVILFMSFGTTSYYPYP
ncbi:MAG: hypothetical protein GX919_05790 [Acholeplasmataceae bacterium]|jgi:predicted RNA-binding Zn-ribbon protein involved in translation (DUF1610 family)|nr:hypothetical protein [Acholeplasmataceae bacterium]